MKYSNEEKLSIITRYQQGESAIALSNELAIPRSTLYRWFNSFPTDSSGKPLKFSYQEYALLQRKVEKLQNIITILKSVDCLVSAPLKERLHALEPFYGKYEVHTICEALDVDRGTFYNHMLRSKRGNAWFDKRHQEYCQLIRDVFDEYRQVLGAEKIRTILIQRGHQVSAEYISQHSQVSLTCSNWVGSFILVRPTGFEPAAFRVGVIRPSSRKALRRKALIGLAQISGILRKNLGSLAGQDFRGFSR